MNFDKFKISGKFKHLQDKGVLKKILAAVVLLILLITFLTLLIAKQGGDNYKTPAITLSIESLRTKANTDSQLTLSSARTRPTNRFRAEVADTSQPMVAIIMTGLGLQQENTQKAITELPAAVTIALSPYGVDNMNWIDQAIEYQHEILIGIPMEPRDYPDTDPGPLTLLRRDSWEDNLKNLNTIAMPYDRPVGYINEFGNSYLSSDVQNRRFLDWIQLEEAVFVENLIDNQNPPMNELSQQISADYIASDLQIDALANTNAIVARLRKLERDAKEKGYAVGIASPYPLTIEVLKQWAKDLEGRGVVLSPISAVVQKRKGK